MDVDDLGAARTTRDLQAVPASRSPFAAAARWRAGGVLEGHPVALIAAAADGQHGGAGRGGLDRRAVLVEAVERNVGYAQCQAAGGVGVAEQEFLAGTGGAQECLDRALR